MYTFSFLFLIAVGSALEAAVLRQWFTNPFASIFTNASLFSILFVNLALWIWYRSVLYPKFFSSLRHLPTAKRRFPVVGYGPIQFSNTRGALLHAMMKTIPNNGLIRFQGFMDAENLLLTSPEALSDVLVKHSYHFSKPPGAKKLFKQFLGDDVLFVSHGEKHRNDKKIMQPPFNLRKTQELYPMFWSKGVAMTELIKNSRERDSQGAVVLDFDAVINKPVIDAVFGAMFGKKFEDSPHKEEMARLGESVISPKWDVRFYFMLTAFMPFWTRKLIPGGIDKRVNATSIRLQQAVTELIAERRMSIGKGVYDDIAIQLLETNHFTDKELMSNFIGLMIAAIEPTAAAITWSLWYMSKHREWQHRLRAEIQAKIPYEYFEDSKHSFHDAGSIIDNLVILNAVCNESLRMMPPSPTTNRVAICNTTIAGQPVPAGTKIFMNAYAANRSHEVWGPDSETWDPTRWMEVEDGKDGHASNHSGRRPKGLNSGAATGSNFGFLPFNHGPRKCIGHIYAQAKIRAFLAAIVGRFEFEMANESESMSPGGILVAKPNKGLKLKFNPSGRW